MVALKEITKKLDELSQFFASIEQGSDATITDKESALYGLDKVQFIRDQIDKYKEKPSNVLLKRMHSAFFSITRGVEGFVDYDIDQEFRKTREGITTIINDLENNIKW